MIDPGHCFSLLAAAMLLLCAIPASADPAPPTITNTWTAELEGDGTLQLNLQREGGRGWHGQRIPLSSLRGLPREQALARATVRFELVRDAGTIVFDGTFQGGRGRGTFALTPSAAFLSDMAAHGYSGLSPGQLLFMTVVDVNRDYVRELERLGYTRLPTQQLIQRLSTEQLMQLRSHKVTPGFIRELRTLRYGRLTADQLVIMRDHGVTPGFIRELRALGYDRPTVDQLVIMRDHKVTPDFIRELQALGYDRLTVDQLVIMRDHKVTPGFIRELQALGYDRPTVDQLVTMRDHGVTPGFIRELQALGYDRLTVDQLVTMRDHGVTPPAR
jgi:hypothetical protein